MKQNLLLLVSWLCLGISPIIAQQAAKFDFSIEVIKKIDKDTPREFAYAETPDCAFRKNKKDFLRNLTPAQTATLTRYEYPKFLSHGFDTLEADLTVYYEALRAWEADNASRFRQIRTELGIER